MSVFIRMLRCQSGASAAEYALILAILGTGVILAALYLGNAITNRLYASGNCIQSSANC